jgi:hypothetical protein
MSNNSNPRTSQIKQRTNLKQLGQVADKYLSEVLDDPLVLQCVI